MNKKIKKLCAKTIFGFQTLILTLGLSGLPNTINQNSKFEQTKNQISLNQNRAIKRQENLKKRLKETDCPKERKILIKYGNMDHKEVIKEIDTIEKVKEYRNHYLKYKNDQEVFGKSDYMASFAEIHANMADDCDGYATAIAALLSDNGYKPLIFGILKKNASHAVFVYKKNGLYGVLDQSSKSDREPKYSTLEDLARSMGYNQYQDLINLEKKYKNWIDNEKDMSDIWKNRTYKKVRLQICPINRSEK